MTSDQFEGCLLGLALGDALGAPFEGGLLERLVWRFLGRTSAGHARWTDDTQMAKDTAESLLANGALDPDDLARRFAASYRWSRGYGPGTAKMLKRIARGADWRSANRSVYPQGSFGNGGAMRAPVVGLFYAARPQELVEAARLAASITHAHPLGIEGAVLVASATALALRETDPCRLFEGAASFCEQEPFVTRAVIAAGWLRTGATPTAGEVARALGHGIAASESCVTAVYAAARFLRRPLLELLEFLRVVGGDVDTIGAMAGAVWGGANGAAALPAAALARLEQREALVALAGALHSKCC